MYITKEKIIYSPYEHLTYFSLYTKQVDGYLFLDTRGERSRYAVNTVPVFMNRDKNIENGRLVHRYWEESVMSQEILMKKRLRDYFLFLKLRLIYEKARFFLPGYHLFCEEFDGDFFNSFSSPKGYDWQESFKKLDFDESFYFRKFQSFLNYEIVICEKAVGEKKYSMPGVPLSKKDKRDLGLNKIKGGLV